MTPIVYITNLLQSYNDRLILGILGFLGFCVSLLLIINMLRKKPPLQTDIIETSLGKIKMTINSLENISVKVVKRFQGIKEAKARVKSTPDGIALFIELNIAPDINIPELTTDIQNQLNEYFSKYIGLHVEEIKILVVNVNYEQKSRVN